MLACQEKRLSLYTGRPLTEQGFNRKVQISAIADEDSNPPSPVYINRVPTLASASERKTRLDRIEQVCAKVSIMLNCPIRLMA